MANLKKVKKACVHREIYEEKTCSPMCINMHVYLKVLGNDGIMFYYNLNSPLNYNEDGVGSSMPKALKISL